MARAGAKWLGPKDVASCACQTLLAEGIICLPAHQAWHPVLHAPLLLVDHSDQEQQQQCSTRCSANCRRCPHQPPAINVTAGLPHKPACFFARLTSPCTANIHQSTWVVPGSQGNTIIVGRRSQFSLYDEKIASFEDDGGLYDQKDAAGFIKLQALRLRTLGVARTQLGRLRNPDL